MAVSPNTIQKFPESFSTAIDEVLAGATYASKYNVQGAEFVSGRTVNVPDIDFGNLTEPDDYDRFATEHGVTLNYTPYKLDNDKQMQFYVDATEDIDNAAILTASEVGEFERTILAPYIDKGFFGTAVKRAGTSKVEASIADIKASIRAMRSAFTEKGLAGGELYCTSDVVAALENAVNREFSNDTTITDTVGNYDGFNIYEVPSALLGANTNFIGISGGLKTIRYITKRAANYTFAPGTHTKGDGWLTQLRWIYGTIVYNNKRPGIYLNKKA